ncbi:MAG: hypothetical protein LH629_02610 [Ignavibacteria bacterium]|nr:hypothetical protein [Ignavibacteria bacterium]
MKKIFLLAIAFFCLCFSSCEKDESLDPRPLLVGGQFVRLDITRPRMNSQDINNTSFGGLLTAPSGNVAKFNLYVRKYDGILPATEFKLVKTITSFPTDLSITPQDIATALGLQLTDLKFADVFRFYGESFDSNGNRADYYSLSAIVQTTISYKQAYRFVSDLTNTDGLTQQELSVFDSYPPQ